MAVEEIGAGALVSRLAAAVAAEPDPDGATLLVVRLDTGSVDLPRHAAVPRWPNAVLSSFPGVVVGVAETPVADPPDHLCDLLLTTAPDPPPPWVGVADLGAATAWLGEVVAGTPQATRVLAQVLRHAEHARLEPGLLAESTAYSTLLGGPEFARWLDERGPPRPRRPSPDGTVVDARREDGTLHLALDRPEVRNAFDATMRERLTDLLVGAWRDTSVTRIVLTGRGSAFCAGGDLAEFGTARDPVSAHLVRAHRSPARLLGALSDRLEARLHGACIGAGIELPAFAGTVVARADTVVRLPEVGMGLIPGAGGTVSLPPRIGRHRTAWLALTGAELDARSALAWGLADTVS